MQEGQVIGTFDSKSGKRVLIRAISHDDVAVLLKYINELSAEDTYLLVSGEQFTHAEEEVFVRGVVDHMLAGNYIYVLAFVGKRLVATGSVRRVLENRKRSLHVGEVGLMVHADFRSDGIGAIVLEQLLTLARTMNNMRVLKLGVFGPNEKAKKLYTKFGFKHGGGVPGSVLRKGEYIDHDVMYISLAD